MIYLICEMYDELSPRISAFTNKRDFKKALIKCREYEVKINKEHHYSYDTFVIPYSKTKAGLCENISRYAFGILGSCHG